MPPEGISSYEPKNADASEAIAALVAKKAGQEICPRIRECFAAGLNCMSIMNRHAHSYPDAPAIEAADSVDHRECEVIMNCDQNFACETVHIPMGLLLQDRR